MEPDHLTLLEQQWCMQHVGGGGGGGERQTSDFASTAHAGTTIVKNAIDSIPPQVHQAAAFVADIPAPIQLACAILAAVGAAVFGADYIQRRWPKIVPQLQKTYFVRYMISGTGHDVVFETMYFVGVMIAILGMCIIACITGRINSAVVIGLLVSFVGVRFSAWVDGELQFADPDTMAGEAAARWPSMRRRLFLHATVGIALATIVLGVTRLSPFPELNLDKITT